MNHLCQSNDRKPVPIAETPMGRAFCVYDEPSAGSCPKGLASRRSTKAGIWRMYIIETIVKMVYDEPACYLIVE